MPGRRAGRGGRGRVTVAAGMLTGVAMRVSSPVLVGRSGQPVLAINLAEPLVSLGRWDEAGEVIERVRQLLPPRLSRSSLWRLSGDMALARGDRDAGGTRAAPGRRAGDRGRPVTGARWFRRRPAPAGSRRTPGSWSCRIHRSADLRQVSVLPRFRRVSPVIRARVQHLSWQATDLPS